MCEQAEDTRTVFPTRSKVRQLTFKIHPESSLFAPFDTGTNTFVSRGFLEDGTEVEWIGGCWQPVHTSQH
jgi:hypothetical protein